MNCISKLSGVLLPLLALSTVAACGGGGGGGGSTPVGGPTNLSYGAATQTLARSIQLSALTPTFTGTADAFAVTTGTLPTGLSIDAATGTITGMATATQASSSVTVTASLTGGTSDTFDIDFTVGTGTARALYLASEADGVLAIASVDPVTGGVTMRGDKTGLDSPRALALTPGLGFLYAANSGTGMINAYAVDPGTGDLAELAGSPFPMIGGIALAPTAAATSPDGSTLYVANRLGNNISMFTIAANGSLTEKVGSPFGSYTTPRDVAVSHLASGDFLYLVAKAATNPVVTLAIAADGTLTEIDADTAGGGPIGIKMTPDGTLAYVTNESDSTVSAYAAAADGTLTELVSSPTAIAGAGTFLSGITLTDDGTMRTLYTTSLNGVISQFAIAGDGSLSLLTPDSATAIGATLLAVASTPDGSAVYTCDSNGIEVTSFEVGATGALTALSALQRVRTPGAIRAALILPSVTPATWSTDNLYATNFSGDSLSSFDVDGTGAMTAQIPLDSATATDPEDVIISTNGQMLYLSHPGHATAPLMTVPLLADGTPDILNATAVAGNNAQFLACDNNTDFLYVVDGTARTLRPFPIDANGAIGAPGASMSLGLIPFSVTLDPTGRFAYVVNFTSGTVSQFSVDLVTGALSALTPATVVTGLNPRSIAIHPSGRYAYVTAKGATGVGGDAIGQYAINATTGALTLMATPQMVGGTDPGAITVSQDGRFVIVANSGESTIMTYSVNDLDGNGTENGNLVGPLDSAATTTQPQTLAMSADGTTVYVGINVGTGIEAFSVDANGMLTSLDVEVTGKVHDIALRETRQ